MNLARLWYLAVAFMVFATGLPAHAEQKDWIDGDRLVLQTLDKVTARIQRVDAVIGEAVRFGTLEIIPYYCAFRPPELPPDHSAFLEIRDIALNVGRTKLRPQTDSTSDSSDSDQRVFSGWMFASSPAISGLEHAVYDVTLLSCSK